MADSFVLLAALISVALIFDFLNGLHDAANSIATVVSTRVLSPNVAVVWAAFFNFIAFLFFGLHVAHYYLPPEDIRMEYLRATPQSSWCEWKGRATYFDVVINGLDLPGSLEILQVAWTYDDPTPSFAAIGNYVAFYAGPLDGCFVDGEKVLPQPGGFYGGWITSDIVGPFKGEPGTWGW